MSDLVEREAVFEMLENSYMGGNEFYDDLFELAEKLPTVEERRKGKWVEETIQILGLPHIQYRCNLCGSVHYGRIQSRKFCSGCGAEMEGEKDDP